MNSTTVKALEDVTDQELVRSLSGDVCPGCGGYKRPAQTLCGKQYFQLHPAKRKALYNRLGEGYREAVADALQTLNGNTDVWIAPPKKAP